MVMGIELYGIIKDIGVRELKFWKMSKPILEI